MATYCTRYYRRIEPVGVVYCIILIPVPGTVAVTAGRKPGNEVLR
jgi:hypothetical protein